MEIRDSAPGGWVLNHLPLARHQFQALGHTLSALVKRTAAAWADRRHRIEGASTEVVDRPRIGISRRTDGETVGLHGPIPREEAAAGGMAERFAVDEDLRVSPAFHAGRRAAYDGQHAVGADRCLFRYALPVLVSGKNGARRETGVVVIQGFGGHGLGALGERGRRAPFALDRRRGQRGRIARLCHGQDFLYGKVASPQAPAADGIWLWLELENPVTESPSANPLATLSPFFQPLAAYLRLFLSNSPHPVPVRYGARARILEERFERAVRDFDPRARRGVQENVLKSRDVAQIVGAIVLSVRIDVIDNVVCRRPGPVKGCCYDPVYHMAIDLKVA